VTMVANLLFLLLGLLAFWLLYLLTAQVERW
jgi:hypothetical protein